MSPLTGAAIYFAIWWTVLFAVLPLGVRSQGEDGDPLPGSDSGAPARPRLVLKALITTAVSALIFAVLYVIYVNQLITLDDIPFLPRFDDYRQL